MRIKSLFKPLITLVVTMSVVLSMGIALSASSAVPCESYNVGDTIEAGTTIRYFRNSAACALFIADSMDDYRAGHFNNKTVRGYTTWTADTTYTVVRKTGGSGAAMYCDLYLVTVSDDPSPSESSSSSTAHSLTPEELRLMSVRAFVENLYIRLLGRTYDVAGRDFWVDQLMNQGATGADVVRGFIKSPEFNPGELTEEELVNELYNDLYDRVPSAGETAVWTGALKDGASRDSVLDFFLSSPEWASVCAFYQVNP